MSEFKLNFQDTKTAFADKSNSELKEKYRLFQDDEFADFEQSSEQKPRSLRCQSVCRSKV